MTSSPPRIGITSEPGLVRLGGFGRPFGIGRDAQGHILATDMDLHGIVRFTPDLVVYQWLGGEAGWSEELPLTPWQAERSPPRPPGRFNGPHSVSSGPDGRLYVTTYYDPALHILAPGGELAARIDGEKSLFQFKGPATGILDIHERVLVTEYALNGVFVLSSNGDFLGALGGGQNGFRRVASFTPSSRAGFFDRPHMAVSTKNGDIIVADTWNHRLQKFSSTGRFIGILGGGKEGWQDAGAVTAPSATPTGFHAPVAISIADDERLLVTDWGNNRLKWIDAEGYVLEVEQSLGLNKPYDAQILGERYYVANSHMGEIIIKDV